MHDTLRGASLWSLLAWPLRSGWCRRSMRRSSSQKTQRRVLVLCDPDHDCLRLHPGDCKKIPYVSGPIPVQLYQISLIETYRDEGSSAARREGTPRPSAMSSGHRDVVLVENSGVLVGLAECSLPFHLLTRARTRWPQPIQPLCAHFGTPSSAHSGLVQRG